MNQQQVKAVSEAEKVLASTCGQLYLTMAVGTFERDSMEALRGLLTFFDSRQQHVPIDKAAHIAGVCRRTMYNWIKQGKVEYARTPSGSIRVRTSSLFKLDQPADDDAIQNS